MSRTLTLVVIWATVALLIAYDVWAAFTPGATLSETMLSMGHRHPIIPFAMGVLIGHFWAGQAAEAQWQTAHPYQRPKSSFLLWLGLGLLVVGVIMVLSGV